MSSDGTTASETTTREGSPFNYPGADVIIRSSDHVDFALSKIFLVLTSKTFEDLFAIPQAQEQKPKDMEDGIPIVSVADDSATLRLVLPFCFPREAAALPSSPLDLPIIAVMLEAARKYQMIAPRKLAREQLVSTQYLENIPLQVLGIALKYELKEETKLAALHLSNDFREDCPPEIKEISGERLYGLLQYQARCHKVLNGYVSSGDASQLLAAVDSETANRTDRTQLRRSRWWKSEVKRISESQLAVKSKTSRVLINLPCGRCVLEGVVERFTAEVEKIELNLTFYDD